MIVINDDAPRWIRELDRFIHLKSQLFVHGNVLDMVSYPVLSANGDKRYWTESNLEGFFNRYLVGLGYEVVAAFDPVGGLSFAEQSMHELFERVLSGESASGDKAAAQPSAKRKSGVLRRPPGPSALVDAEPIVQQLAAALNQREIPCAFVIHLSSRLLSSPERLSREERGLFTRILKASQEAKEVLRGEQRWNNTLILVCDKPNDLPAFLYLNNPRSHSIHIDKPSAAERARFIRSKYGSFHGAVKGQAPGTDLVALFSILTEGLSHYELLSLVGLSVREHIPVEDIRNLCERFKYGIKESDWDKLDKARLDKSEELIRTRIKGQDVAVQRLLQIIKRAKLGMAAGSVQRNQRPRGVLFFAGPTGVGKTEMAKGLAELLFGEEERLVRFDMSEYAAPHADQKLLGSPPGYVGYEEGGKLTNAIKAQPFSVLLFDEIEKAHPSIFDKFLQILDDGRLTDGQGETVYFSECIIIFTSNLGAVADANDEAARAPLVTPDMPYAQVNSLILGRIRDHFNFVMGRPEILNRFGDNFVVFDFIRPPVDEQIIDRLVDQLRASVAEQQKITLSIAPLVRTALIALAKEKLNHGGRGIRNLIESALVNPLASQLFDLDVSEGADVSVTDLIDNGAEVTNRFQVTVEVSSHAAHAIRTADG